MYQSPLVLSKFKIYSIEPETLEIEKLFASPIDREPFSEFSNITYKNVPQPKGRVFRSNFEIETNTDKKTVDGPTLVKRKR